MMRMEAVLPNPRFPGWPEGIRGHHTDFRGIRPSMLFFAIVAVGCPWPWTWGMPRTHSFGRVVAKGSKCPAPPRFIVAAIVPPPRRGGKGGAVSDAPLGLSRRGATGQTHR